MRYAIIVGGKVANVTLADADFAAAQGWIAAPEEVGPGWLWDGQAFTAPEPEPAPVPKAITRRQARLALLGAGLLEQVDAAIAAMPGVEGQAAQIEWADASEIHRDHPMIASLGPALGLTGEQIDALFVAGAGL